MKSAIRHFTKHIDAYFLAQLIMGVGGVVGGIEYNLFPLFVIGVFLIFIGFFYYAVTLYLDGGNEQ